jgi:predicted metal-binding membrane protein
LAELTTDPEPSVRTLAPGLPRRDRIAILSGLAGATLLAWVYLLMEVARMDAGMAAAESMGSAAMDGGMAGAMMQLRPWAAVDFALMFLMWAVMMVGMMVPSAAPMALVYAAVSRKASRQGETIAPTAVFVAGYIAMWLLFSVAATGLQWALERAALLSPMMVSTSPMLGASLLVAAGIYQMTPQKDACLRHCRSPVYFISEHWRPGLRGAFRMGLVHGAYCLGCCWLLMGILFFGGVMNLLWIGAITIFVLLEKVLPLGVTGGRVAGVALIALGVVVGFGFGAE